jgi:rhomboid family GlyGly-CTERM serine protease
MSLRGSVTRAFARLTQARWQDWWLPVAIGLALPAIQAGASIDAWRYDRSAVLAHQWWRLVTGHLVHADARHLGWNLLGLALVWWLFANQYTVRAWVAILLASTVAIDAGFLVLMPDLEWYVGFSGVLHGMMAAGLLAWLVRTRDPLTWLVAVLFAAKLVWEHAVGPLPLAARSMQMPVIHEAHSFGALGGLLAAAVLLARRAEPQPSL